MAFDLKGALASIAPTLATMLGGPLAGTAVSALEGALGLNAGVGTDGITKVMQTGAMTPEQIAAIRVADQKHAEVMSQQNIDILKINSDYQASIIKDDTENVINARNENVIGGTQKYLFVLSILILATVLGAECCVLAWGIPKDVDDTVAGRILGTLDAVGLMVMTYWYGTTHSSAVKTNILAQQAATK